MSVYIVEANSHKMRLSPTSEGNLSSWLFVSIFLHDVDLIAVSDAPGNFQRRSNFETLFTQFQRTVVNRGRSPGSPDIWDFRSFQAVQSQPTRRDWGRCFPKLEVDIKLPTVWPLAKMPWVELRIHSVEPRSRNGTRVLWVS